MLGCDWSIGAKEHKRKHVTKNNRLFPSSQVPLYQNEVKCSAFDMKMIFHSHASKTHFHMKGCALRLILKVRIFKTRKWPIWKVSVTTTAFQQLISKTESSRREKLHVRARILNHLRTYGLLVFTNLEHKCAASDKLGAG